MLDQDARDGISRPTRGGGHNHGDRPRRIGLRTRDARQRLRRRPHPAGSRRRKADQAAPIAVGPSDARERRSVRREDSVQSNAPAASDSLAPARCSTRPEARQLAAVHSITSSAHASRLSGTVRPSNLAVVRSMTRSNFVEARRMRVCYPSRPSARMVSCTFGLAPIRAMYALMFGHFARSILWILVQLSTVNR